MKYALLLFILCFLTGCSAGEDPLNKPMELRKNILESEQCRFDSVITVHYSDSIYQFEMSSSVDDAGKLTFSVTGPDSISGITGSISQDGAALTFDDAVLAFPTLANDRLTPVSAPWIFYNTLRCGYISGCQKSEAGFVFSIDDSYEEGALHLEITTDSNCIPNHAEIFYQNHMVLSLDIKNFTLM